MLKLKKLIKEHTWDREFGEPLPTFEDVMGKHQVNKLKEDWWDDMSPEDQASYIKDHPGSKQAQDAGGDEPEKITKGPGGYGDRGNVRGGDQRNFGEPDDEEYFKSMMGGGEPEDKPHGGDTGKDADYSPEHPDNMDDRDVFQFLNKDEPEDEGEPYKREPFQPGDDPEELSVGAAQEELEKAKAEMADAEERGDKAAYADAEEKADALEGRLGVTDEPDEIDLGKPYPDGNAPPKTSMVDRFSSQEHLDNSLEQQKQYQSHLNKWAEEAADNDDDETLAKIQELDDENKKEIERLEKDGAKGMYRTGNELNQETLTIDGKQFRRIGESVEKEEKPKYEFSEFYQRFKR